MRNLHCQAMRWPAAWCCPCPAARLQPADGCSLNTIAAEHLLKPRCAGTPAPRASGAVLPVTTRSSPSGRAGWSTAMALLPSPTTGWHALKSFPKPRRQQSAELQSPGASARPRQTAHRIQTCRLSGCSASGFLSSACAVLRHA